jgi:hypothetical protein
VSGRSDAGPPALSPGPPDAPVPAAVECPSPRPAPAPSRCAGAGVRAVSLTCDDGPVWGNADGGETPLERLTDRRGLGVAMGSS